MALTESQIRRALERNRARLRRVRDQEWYIGEVRSKVGLSGDQIDESFVESIADWQHQFSNRHVERPLRVDGVMGPRTEAHLGIELPAMNRLVRAMHHYLSEGGILFDSWSNDFRDNDGDGQVDERDEAVSDGAHLGRVYDGFSIGPSDSGSSQGGWRDQRRNVQGIPSVVTPVDGQYRYMMCSDLVSQAMIDARIIRQRGRTAQLIGTLLPPVAYVFRRDVDYPEEYLPGDYIATFEAGHGGHSAVVVEAAPTYGGSAGPHVIELPGPSTMISEGYYRPSGQHGEPQSSRGALPPRRTGVRSDVMMTEWPLARRQSEHARYQYIGRFIYSRIGRRGR